MGTTSIGFWGAAGTVTGSRFLVTTPKARVLLDCGLFQGLKVLRKRNWKRPGFDPSTIDAVFLTHAHIDHSGYLPRLVREGFNGEIWCTRATYDLCKILLPDCGRIQEEDARYAARKGFSKHAHPEPLYTEEDALATLKRFAPMKFDEEFELRDLTGRFTPAGHILGAASVTVGTPAGKVLFSGDLGRDDDMVMPPPEPPTDPDWVVMESTYGDREHPEDDALDALATPLVRTLERGGTVLIPSFAVARTQALLLAIAELMESKRIPEVPVYVDSPMATNVTEVYADHDRLHRLTSERCAEVFGRAKYTRTPDESKELSADMRRKIVISASGMLTGGRVLHHIKAFGGDAQNLIVLAGYQPPGTRGRALLDGAGELRIHGRMVPIEAEVVSLPYFSAHADRSQLVDWLSKCQKPPRGTFLVHGDPEAAESLRQTVRDRLGYAVDVPDQGEVVELD
ncbi:Ribonuclease [Planctomycetes bacterium Pla163]|uniref:Ribonuclease n=1 Tax=Rohdeia mirabilis TaxID=2528008 RepID=A0A518D2H5_9BACT|nr:Ribonuclease [Planctomycetes bacterium Pla163]